MGRLIENEVGFGVHIRVAGDLGIELAVDQRHSAFEDGTDDALLPPHLAGLQFAIGVEAGQLGAGAGAAGRTVVGLAWAEHEALAVGAGVGGRAEELDVVDLAAVAAGDPLRFDALADAPGEIGKLVNAVEREVLAVIATQEKPVAAPGDIAVDGPDARRVHRDVRRAAIAGHVADGTLPLSFRRASTVPQTVSRRQVPRWMRPMWAA